MLKISNLLATIQNNLILNNLNLEIEPGKLHIIMGPNGSGKSTLARILASDPEVKITSGSIFFGNKDITKLNPEEKFNLGIFVAFQNPTEVPGVNFASFLRLAYNKKFNANLSPIAFKKIAEEKLCQVGLLPNFLDRNLNDGLSGGEKKKGEILQLLLFNPKFAILDEIDSGLDIDSTKKIFKIISSLKDMGIVVITHNVGILSYLNPDFVHQMQNGAIIKSAGAEIITRIKNEGYGK